MALRERTWRLWLIYKKKGAGLYMEPATTRVPLYPLTNLYYEYSVSKKALHPAWSLPEKPMSSNPLNCLR